MTDPLPERDLERSAEAAAAEGLAGLRQYDLDEVRTLGSAAIADKARTALGDDARA